MSDIELRPAVREFAERMEQVLRANDYKEGWQNCDNDWLLYRLWQEAAELSQVLQDEGRRFGSITKEAADVANFAMFIADNAKGG